MPTLSGCTVVRNAVKLKYPLEASIQTYLPICDEVVVAHDPTSEDDTEKLVQDLARRFPKIRPLACPWDLTNRNGGSEIAIQSNVAIEACEGDWVLYVQADEAIHEGDHEAIRAALERSDLSGAVFDRKSFLYSLGDEIPEYRANGLLRLFRNGLGFAVGDAMSCGLVQGAAGQVLNAGWRLYNYSRIGDREEILHRSRSLHGFYRSSKAEIEQQLMREGAQSVRPYDAESHPLPIRRHYALGVVPARSERMSRFPVTLAVLLGPGEHENIPSFLEAFRDWPGDVVVLDDTGGDGGADLFARAAQEVAALPPERLTVRMHGLRGDFAAARNDAHRHARGAWVLHADLDERWNPDTLRGITRLTEQLERDGKAACGFPRANTLDGVMVNDIPDTEWTPEGLARAKSHVTWPPGNRDVQYRLIKREIEWEGPIHERPSAVRTAPDRVVDLRDHWVTHAKTLSRQRRQDGLYRSLGQTRGMPREDSIVVPDTVNLREEVLREAVGRLPGGPLVVVETGTLRDASPQARFGDGWSTYHLARYLADRGVQGSRLYSIDIDPRCVETSKRAVPPELHPWVTWICADSRETLKTLSEERIDLLYLDSSDDPALIAQEFETALPKLAAHSIVVIDDTGEYSAGPEGKGSLLIPKLKLQSWRIEHRNQGTSRMTIASKPA